MRKMIMIIAAVAVIATGCAREPEPLTPKPPTLQTEKSWVEYEACMRMAFGVNEVTRCLKVKP